MRTRRIIGVVFAVGILCFCFAGSIDNAATRPWVRSLIDYVTGTVVPTSSVAYATSAGTSATSTNLSDGITKADLFSDEESDTYTNMFRIYSLASPTRYVAQDASALITRYQYSGPAYWDFGLSSPSVPTTFALRYAGGLHEYLFGSGGNVITGNYPNAVFSQTTSVTRLSVGSGFKFDMWINGGGPWAYFDAMGLATLDFIPSTVQTMQPLLTFHFADWYSYFRSDVYVTSNLNVTGTATVSRVVQTTGDWDDLNFPAVESARVGTDDLEFNTASNGLVFKTTCTTNLTDDHELRMVHFPHSWATNTPIKPHIHFVQTSADQTNMFFLRYKWYNNGSLVPSTWTDLGYASNTIAYTSGEMVQIAAWPQIQAVRNISSIMDVKIYRDGSVGTGDVLEKQFDVHIRRDTFGSVAEFTK